LTGRKWSIAEVNEWDREEFTTRLGFLFESSPWIVAQGWEQRPFRDRDHLFRTLTAIPFAASEAQQLALIRAHPDLVGRAALAGTLTRASTGEQLAAGLDPDQLTSTEIAQFQQLNDAYKKRFDFPFVICARENKKASILAGFESRLNNGKAQEIETALAEIRKICWYRLIDFVDE
jgi:OHCU decarboxylase